MSERESRRISGYEMTERLIECVKKHPYLFDMRDDGYKNVVMKSVVWEQIGKEIGETGEIAKTKWKSLRDNYGRYKKEMADPNNQVKKFLRWPWANHLQFLDGIMERERKGSRKNTPPPQQFLEISLTEPEIEETSRDSEYSETATSPTSPADEEDHEDGNNAPSAKRIKRENNIPERPQELDAITHLFKSYAETFKTFNRRNQIALKVELAQLFADIEAKEMIERN